MPRILLETSGNTNLEKALNYVPTIKKLYDDAYVFLWNEPLIEAELKEKIRLYLANINGCATCMSLSYVSESKWNEPIKQAVQNKDFSNFSKFDQKLFHLIDLYRQNPREVTEEEIKWLQNFYTNEGIMTLLAFINMFDNYHKMIVSLDLYDFCKLG